MSLTKKYVYVHHCSLAEDTPDNFRKVMGRAWVPSSRLGLQYGFNVDPPVMDMTFGPYLEWEHDYFFSTQVPATTQLVSIKPNPYYFPPIPDAEEPCCGWYAYLGRFFADHFSSGNPLQILRGGLKDRVAGYRASLSDLGYSGPIDQKYFPDDSCGRRLNYGPIQSDDPEDTPPPEVNIPGAMALVSNSMAVPVNPNQAGPEPEQAETNRAKVRLFRDLWFQMFAPFSELEDGYLEGKPKAMVGDVKFSYNFFLEAYERQLRGNTLPEIRIPNLYLSVYKDGSVPYVLYLSENVGCRFKEFAKLVLQKGYTEYLIPVKQQPFLQDKNVYSKSFPMDATVSFSTDRNTFVADALEDSKLECNMLRRVSEGEVRLDVATTPPTAFTPTSEGNLKPPPEETMEFAYAKRYYDTLSNAYTPKASVPNQVSNYKASYGPFGRDLRTFDFYQWMMSLPDIPASSVSFPGDHVFLGNQNDSTDMALRSGLYQRDLSYLANYFIMSGKVNQIAETHLRTYQQMMRGDTPHSETILYKLSKYSTAELQQQLETVLSSSPMLRDQILLGNDGTAALAGEDFEKLEAIFDEIEQIGITPIQNVWIPNSNSIDIFEYVDTQVKYNKEYTYVVTAYQLSVGTEYFYSQYFGQRPEDPQPQPCENATIGNQAIAGVYNLQESPLDVTGVPPTGTAVPLLRIVYDASLSEGEKYNLINQFLSENNQWKSLTGGGPVDTCEGTGMAILRRQISDGGTDQSGQSFGPEFEYLVLCYCFDFFNPNPDQWSVVTIIENKQVRSSGDQTAGTGKNEPACTIYGQLRVALRAELNLVDASSITDEILEVFGVTDPADLPTYQRTTTVRGRLRAEQCPDGWIEGKVQRQVTTAEATSYAAGFEVTALGATELKAVCECPEPEPCRETFLVTTFPSLKVHEIPYMLWSGKVTDSHPVGPDVEINPYRAVNNEMLFQIGACLGDYYDRPIAIFEREKAMFEELLRSQRSTDGNVLFSSDDPVRGFESLMLTDKPTRYTDFSTGVRKLISTEVAEKPNQYADAVSMVETLVPNQKYYYIFRSIDVHGHVSNPTPIYEVELVDTDGAIYPLINIYEPDPSLPIDLSKQGQRLLQIRPEYLQSVLDVESSGLSDATTAGTPTGGPAGDLKLGTRSERLWDKNFKMRVTSCETRRMLEINLKFKTEHIALDACPPEYEKTTISANDGLSIPDGVMDLIPGSESKPSNGSAPRSGGGSTSGGTTVTADVSNTISLINGSGGGTTGGGSTGGSSY